MEDKILEALKKLDKSDDELWTKDGLPLLEALGIEGVTRKDVTAAAPDFNRVREPKVEVKAKTSILEVLEGKKAVLGKKLAKAEVLVNEARVFRDELTASLDEVITEISSIHKGVTTQTDIQNFIKSQQEQRIKEAKQLQELSDAGYNVSGLRRKRS